MSPLSSPLRRVAAAVAGVAVAATLAPAAAAAPVAPGAPLRISPADPSLPGIPDEFDTFACSQGVSGEVRRQDGTTGPVMLTAAHCVNSLHPEMPFAAEVKVPKHGGDQVVGTRGASGGPMAENAEVSSVDSTVELFTSQDWAVVDLDPAVPTSRLSESIDYHGNPSGHGVAMTGVRDYRNVPGGQVRVDNFGQPICKDGMVSGRSCGVQIARTQHAVFSWGLSYASGDSGGNNFDPNTGEVIGVTSQGVGPFGRTQTADAALQDAYDIPDGQVNDHFTLPESAAPHDTDFRALEQDGSQALGWMEHNGYAAAETAAPGEQSTQEPAAPASVQQHTDQLFEHVQSGDVDAALDTARHAVDAALGDAQAQWSDALPAPLHF